MIKLFIIWVILALIIMGTCYLPGINVENFKYALIIAAVITLINMFIKPIIKLAAIPINLMTFGLFNLIINFGILYAVSYFIPQYHIDNLISGFIASLVIAVAYTMLKKA